MDNFGSHKAKAVRRLIRSAPRQAVLPALLFARSQSDRAGFAKLKTLLRKTNPRTIEATWRDIGDLLDRFAPEECANHLAKRRLCFGVKGSRSRIRG